MKESKAQNMYDALKNDQRAILDWCEAEIKEYEKLIKIIKKHL